MEARIGENAKILLLYICQLQILNSVFMLIIFLNVQQPYVFPVGQSMGWRVH